MVDIESIDKDRKTVTFSDEINDKKTITMDDYYTMFVQYFNKRIAGETLMPADLERFNERSSSRNLKQLLDAKKDEGYQEGSMDTALFTPKQKKIAIISIVVIVFVMFIVLYMARSMGFISF